MASEWPVLSLREAGVQLLDCEHRTPPAADAGYPYIAIPQVKDGRLDLSDARRISHGHFVDWTRKAHPRQWDVVLSRRCNPGETAVVPPDLECALGQNLVLLRADGQGVLPEFLRWLVRSPQWWEQVQTFINVGAVFDSLKCADVPNFRLPIPPLEKQGAIAHILSTLDDKIELNRRMNETLESIARALFQSWFVDFDPVRAKAEGRDTGLPKHIADLFPDSFEESELGEIPKGWRLARWGELVTLEYGKSLKGYEGESRPYPVYGTNGRIGTSLESLCKHPGIVIGRKGAYRGVHYCPEPFFVIDTGFYVEPRLPMQLRWAYYELIRQDINGMDSGSAIPSTSRSDFYGLPVVVPPFEIQEQFATFMEPCWARQEQEREESQALADLRDALLPKLIAGELRLSDARHLIDAAS